jgi:hypothetical protein
MRQPIGKRATQGEGAAKLPVAMTGRFRRET